MADILTQIQDELDMLLHQMYRGLQYIKERAPPSAPPNQPALSSFAEYESQQAAAAAAQSQSQHPSQPTSTQPSDPSQPAIPAPPPTLSEDQLHADIRELSRDLVLKEQQLEILINRLPGIGSSEKEQVERMKELERQLEGIEESRVKAVREKEELVRRVDRGIMGVSGV